MHRSVLVLKQSDLVLERVEIAVGPTSFNFLELPESRKISALRKEFAGLLTAVDLLEDL